jgi:hypothetical protein
MLAMQVIFPRTGTRFVRFKAVEPSLLLGPLMCYIELVRWLTFRPTQISLCTPLRRQDRDCGTQHSGVVDRHVSSLLVQYLALYNALRLVVLGV